jgi:hypothetical protein
MMGDKPVNPWMVIGWLVLIGMLAVVALVVFFGWVTFGGAEISEVFNE